MDVGRDGLQPPWQAAFADIVSAQRSVFIIYIYIVYILYKYCIYTVYIYILIWCMRTYLYIRPFNVYMDPNPSNLAEGRSVQDAGNPKTDLVSSSEQRVVSFPAVAYNPLLFQLDDSYGFEQQQCGLEARMGPTKLAKKRNVLSQWHLYNVLWFWDVNLNCWSLFHTPMQDIDGIRFSG